MTDKLIEAYKKIDEDICASIPNATLAQII